jgi:serine protease Do
VVKRSNKFLVALVLVAFLAGILFTGGILFASGNNWFYSILAGVQGPQAKTGTTTQGALPGVGPNAIANIVEKAGPAVVKIETLVETRDPGFDPFFDDPFFREFFGYQFDFLPRKKLQQGLGSGFIISNDGYILTNEHVVEGAQEIQVSITGKNKPVSAQLVGADRELDLAVLKINAGNNLPTLKLGNSNDVAVGNWVIAIGNPYGLDHTVTVGVISAKGRPVTVQDRSYRNLLQTDASINPGNSGGPLLNLNGEVIGINTAVSAQAQGIGFAIPSDTVQGVLNDLIRKGKVQRGWLGVEIQDVTQSSADYFGLTGTNGVLIRSVVAGGPAARAGLKEGDIIIAWNNTKINSTDELLDMIREAGPGKKVQLSIWRDRKEIKVDVTLDERS